MYQLVHAAADDILFNCSSKSSPKYNSFIHSWIHSILAWRKKNLCHQQLIKIVVWELFTMCGHSRDFEQRVFGLALLRYRSSHVVSVALLVVVRVGGGQVHRQVLHVVHLRVQNRWALRVCSLEVCRGHRQRGLFLTLSLVSRVTGSIIRM